MGLDPEQQLRHWGSIPHLDTASSPAAPEGARIAQLMPSHCCVPSGWCSGEQLWLCGSQNARDTSVPSQEPSESSRCVRAVRQLYLHAERCRRSHSSEKSQQKFDLPRAQPLLQGEGWILQTEIQPCSCLLCPGRLLLPAFPPPRAQLDCDAFIRWVLKHEGCCGLQAAPPALCWGTAAGPFPTPWLSLSAEGPSHEVPPSLSLPHLPRAPLCLQTPPLPLPGAPQRASATTAMMATIPSRARWGEHGLPPPPAMLTPLNSHCCMRPTDGRFQWGEGGSNGWEGFNGPSCPPLTTTGLLHTGPQWEGIPTLHRALLGGGIPAPPSAAFPPTTRALVIRFVFQ